MSTIKDKVKHLTKEEMLKLEPGSVVYIEDLGVKTIPEEARLHAAVIFNWGYKNPYDKSNSLLSDENTIIAVQPAAKALSTVYWYIDSYEEDWLAYRTKEI